MQGLHLTADLAGCPSELPEMTDAAALRRRCLAAVQASGLQPVGELFHRFAPHPAVAGPAGVTGVVLLAESHLAVHTWPERGAVTLDAYVCNFGRDNAARAEALLQALLDAFQPTRQQVQRLQRGFAADR
ncbi:adenosylmethionine decarboxylase [Ideonella sp. B7]|uniref:adenosylmethionine decarboxylase n=1 Tax=Ideonella benzenivorans TaxID=2831643 RepID=UPI001CECEC4D|nr:adenosylmethionine decarboxylase [Ideonella benzenivorans]MCA6215403.1 adenosylmethionine decarboxylase [Ideonella benzenivorans]